MLGHTNIVTEVGHHAPGFYSAMFLDRSLEEMGIRTVQDMRDRFREKHGLLGHLSGAIPGLLAPAGPLGQGQHFAMAGALLHPGTLFPVTIGDGGMGEPYILNSMMHFNTAYPTVTNYLPVLVWNGYSQEHHSMCTTWSNAEMTAYWKGHGFENVVWSMPRISTTATRSAPTWTARQSRPTAAWPSPARCCRPPTAPRSRPCPAAARC
jgi:phosphoketolase